MSKRSKRLYYVALTRAKARLYLPLVPSELWGKQWSGGYARVNKRLLVVESELKGTANEHLFNIIPFRDQPLEHDVDKPAVAGGTLSSWPPPRELLSIGITCGTSTGCAPGMPDMRFVIFADEASVEQ